MNSGASDDSGSEFVPSQQTSDLSSDRDSSQSSQIDSEGWQKYSPVRPMDNLPDFQATPGLEVDIDIDNTAIQYLQLFLTDEMLKNVKSETNRYARQNLLGLSSMSNWRRVTLVELRRFFAICTHMCIVHKPKMSDYWSTDAVKSTPFASSVMSRDRFKQIYSALHLNNNGNDVGDDPLFKVRPVFDTMVYKFKEVYTPKQKVSVDEGLCPYRGRIKFLQYLPDKPHKWGIKLYVLSEAASGYVSKFEVYTGVKGLSNSPHNVVMRLAAPFLGLGYHIYTDNYYTSPTLFHELLDSDTMAVGTVRKNRRGLPKSFANKDKTTKGQLFVFQKANMVAMKWVDKREDAAPNW